MSQHDFEIANQGFPSFRSDLNNGLQALASNSAGATEPSTTYAYQMWYDSTANLLKMRNTDDDAWITLAYFDQTNDEWEVRSAVIQAVDSAGVVIKTDDGTTRLTIADSGAITTQGDLTVGGDLDVSSGTIKLDGNYPVGSNNVALGNTALDSNVSGANNTAIGTDALTANTASNNTAVGFQAGYANTTGDSIVGIGAYALYANTTGQYNTAVGVSALQNNTTALYNTAVGWQSAFSNTTGQYNTAHGMYALYSNTTASNNTAVGYQSLYANTTGASNTAVGNVSGYSNTSGADNTFIGDSAGYFVTTGSKNTIIGRYSGNSGNLDIRTSSNYIVLSDGDGNPRGIFNNNGDFLVAYGQTSNVDGKINDSSGSTTFAVQNSDGIRIAQPGVSYWNRYSDGTIITFRSAGTNEGSISVSGTTVSYNGGHLSRWSQLADNTRDDSIVKGTVMSNLDQMAEWTTDGVTEENEQLNCMKVSDVEGDANVAGVFVNWDDDDDVYTNDMNVAMTGDMVIRIAQGTTVERGDLLMSAGDGTAKPQGDDIVRSKTIAKVTSTHVSHTYDDGSYLVPCVLMAC